MSLFDQKTFDPVRKATKPTKGSVERFDLDIDGRPGRHIIDDDRQLGSLRDALEMPGALSAASFDAALPASFVLTPLLFAGLNFTSNS